MVSPPSLGTQCDVWFKQKTFSKDKDPGEAINILLCYLTNQENENIRK